MSDKSASAAPTVIGVAQIFFVYLMLGPGIAALIYLGLRHFLGGMPAHPEEVATAFYLFGAPAALGSAIVHTLMRRSEWLLGFCTVVITGGALGLIGGPLAAVSGFIAACACYPLAQFLGRRS